MCKTYTKVPNKLYIFEKFEGQRCLSKIMYVSTMRITPLGMKPGFLSILIELCHHLAAPLSWHMDPRSLLPSSPTAPQNTPPRLPSSRNSLEADSFRNEETLISPLQQITEVEEEEEEEKGEDDFLLTDAEAAQMREEEEARIIKAINLSVKSAGHLTNLLPTGTLLFFQFLLPIMSNGGDCAGSGFSIYPVMTIILLIACGVWCFLLSFTDTVKGPNGKLYHGVATPCGLWLPARSAQVFAASRLSRFHLCPLDFLHALLSLSVFTAVALFTPDVTACILPNSELIPTQLQNTLPLVVGFVASFLCILFPSPRRSFDQPLLERLVDASD
ncbi:hypothetical protein GOP47_0008993 [Adiantum capillus-veneris]|uniref:Uncharacterized protein n=1 Tax=Adiantum capillus-veneris TaxID=13818 RepID=A0A9D4ZIJ6_ADICA|nr:hypothetical protein GOP47_0008993 [Adiantum capillus-veneris]